MLTSRARNVLVFVATVAATIFAIIAVTAAAVYLYG